MGLCDYIKTVFDHGIIDGYHETHESCCKGGHRTRCQGPGQEGRDGS